jgi:nucleotide-binding universal stress UspA family protein
MNTRGLMELVILNIGLRLGVITDAIFAMMVIMALVTTSLTTPILSLVYPRRMFEETLAPAEEKPAARGYSVLIPVANPQTGGQLLRLADMIVEPAPANRVYALHLRRPEEHEAYRSGLGESEAEAAPLSALLKQPHAVPVQPISFVSREVASDIVRIAGAWNVDLILMGFHKPVFSSTILGGTVHRVLTSAGCDVGVFVDRGFERGRSILVPFLGSPHDELAMRIAQKIGRNTGAAITVVRVVTPAERRPDDTRDVQAAVDRVFNDPSQPTPVTLRVIEDLSPVNAVLSAASTFDLVIIGVAEEWGLESQLFGFRPERIATQCPTSLLIVRAHQQEAAS